MQSASRGRKILRNGSDIVFLVISYVVAIFFAKRHAAVPVHFLALSAREMLLLVALCLAWNFSSRGTGLYDEFRIRSLGAEFKSLGANVVLHFFLTITVLFAAKSQFLSRFFVLIFFSLLLAMLVLEKAALRLLLRRRQKLGRHVGLVLVVGNGNVARDFCATIAANPNLCLRVRGYVADEPAPCFDSEHLGTIAHLPRVLENDSIDDVVIALPHGAMAQAGRVIEICENYPVHVRIIPDYFKFMGPRFSISRMGAFPIISLRAHPLETPYWRFCKRCFDLLSTVTLFVTVFSWLWPLLALWIKLTSPGPVFFRQERWGEKNRRILCWKFRSMVRESRDVDENGRYQQATRDDPRVTRVGRFLRRSNLDELPQFINVLRGEMSLVGPRPHPTPMNLEVKDSIHHYQLRHLVKPGITGWAQVNGLRGETSDPEMLRRRVEADIWYIENWSFLLDMKIIGLTVWEMLKGDPHAY